MADTTKFEKLEKANKLFAKSFFRKLKKYGYHREGLLCVVNEFLNLVLDEYKTNKVHK